MLKPGLILDTHYVWYPHTMSLLIFDFLNFCILTSKFGSACCLAGFHLQIDENLLKYVLFIYAVSMSCLSKICARNAWKVKLIFSVARKSNGKILAKEFLELIWCLYWYLEQVIIFAQIFPDSFIEHSQEGRFNSKYFRTIQD